MVKGGLSALVQLTVAQKGGEEETHLKTRKPDKSCRLPGVLSLTQRRRDDANRPSV